MELISSLIAKIPAVTNLILALLFGTSAMASIALIAWYYGSEYFSGIETNEIRLWFAAAGGGWLTLAAFAVLAHPYYFKEMPTRVSSWIAVRWRRLAPGRRIDFIVTQDLHVLAWAHMRCRTKVEGRPGVSPFRSLIDNGILIPGTPTSSGLQVMWINARLDLSSIDWRARLGDNEFNRMRKRSDQPGIHA